MTIKMSNCTVELNHVNFLSKVNIVRNALNFITNKFDPSKINSIINSRFSLIKSVFDDIEKNYEVDVVSILTEYYDSKIHNKYAVDKYNSIVTSNNYYSKLQQCYDFIYSFY